MAAAPIRVAQLILVHDLRYLIEPPACRSVPVAVHRNSLAKLFTLTTDKSPLLARKVIKVPNGTDVACGRQIRFCGSLSPRAVTLARASSPSAAVAPAPRRACITMI